MAKMALVASLTTILVLLSNVVHCRAQQAAITPMDLLNITDISAVSIAPDAEHVVFQTHRAVLHSNSYTIEWHSLDLRNAQDRVIITDAGVAPFDYVGQWDALKPVWSADSKEFYFVKAGLTARTLWRSDLLGRTACVTTPRFGSITGLEMSANGMDALLRVQREDHAEFLKTEHSQVFGKQFRVGIPPLAINTNGDSLWQSTFFRPAMRTYTYSLNPADGALRLSNDRSQVSLRRDLKGLMEGFDFTSAPNHWRTAFVAAYRDPNATGSRMRWSVDLIESPASKPVRLSQPFLEDPTLVSWSPGSDVLYYIGATQDSNGDLLATNALTGRTQNLTRTERLLHDCDISFRNMSAVCVAQSATHPDELVAVNLLHHHIEELTHFNDVFSSRRFPRLRRMYHVNRFGDKTFGVLVFPDNYTSGRRYPLVVTTYRSSGLLRGGTGDEYPIYPLASHGMFVLSFDILSTLYIPFSQNDKNAYAPISVIDRDWASPLESLRDIIHNLAKEGLVDSSRIAMTGLSHGTEMTNYNITHSRAFVTAISDGAWNDPFSYYLQTSIWDRLWKFDGLGGSPFAQPFLSRWETISPSLNVGCDASPLLINVDDSEAFQTLQLYWEFRDSGRPIDMYVFQGETHLKQQPVHRYSVYNRNLDWLRYWLLNKRDPDRSKLGQYAFWDYLRRLYKRRIAFLALHPCHSGVAIRPISPARGSRS